MVTLGTGVVTLHHADSYTTTGMAVSADPIADLMCGLYMYIQYNHVLPLASTLIYHFASCTHVHVVNIVKLHGVHVSGWVYI